MFGANVFGWPYLAQAYAGTTIPVGVAAGKPGQTSPSSKTGLTSPSYG